MLRGARDGDAHRLVAAPHRGLDELRKRASDVGSDMTAAPRPAATVRSPEQVAVVARNTQPQHERAKRKAAQGLGGIGVVPLPIKTHHGHMIVRASVMKTVPQPEELRVGEDSTFVRNVSPRDDMRDD